MRAFLVLVVALAAMASVAGGRSGGGPHLVGAIPCPGPGGFDCSTLEVPLDHSGKRRGTLALSVAAGTNVDAPRGVLLQLTGGPGQSGVPYAARFAARLGPAGEQYRIVMFDQRGTGTTALDCPALQRQMGFSDIAPPTAAAVRACARAIGANRDLYGTDDVVADIEYLRRALGARKLTIDGVSYGTYVAERYALAHPPHAAVS